MPPHYIASIISSVIIKDCIVCAMSELEDALKNRKSGRRLHRKGPRGHDTRVKSVAATGKGILDGRPEAVPRTRLDTHTGIGTGDFARSTESLGLFGVGVMPVRYSWIRN